MSSTPSLKHNDAKEHDSFLIIISNFFSPSFTFRSGPIFVHDFVLILFHSVFCLSCLTTHRCVHLLRSLLLYFPFVLSLSTQHQKVNILFRFRIPTSCHCYCEKKYSAFHFGSSFTFDFWMDQFQMFSILSSQFGMQTKRRRKQQQHEKLVLIKSRLNALAAQIRRWIYFSFNGCVHLICCSMPVSRPVHSHTHALCTHKFAYCHEFLRVFSVERCDCEGSQRKLCKPSRLHWSK